MKVIIYLLPKPLHVVSLISISKYKHTVSSAYFMKEFEYQISSPLYLGTHWSERKLPGVLTVAGSDSSGGAGVEADVKTISAQGCYAMTCITALTCQTPGKVYSFINTDEQHIKEILGHNLRSMRCDAIKIGMLNLGALKAVVSQLDQIKVPIVLDPVMVATSGSPLSSGDVWESSEIKLLMDKVALITPNIPEAKALIRDESYDLKTVSDMVALSKRVAADCRCNVLLKGGHCPIEGKVIDVLFVDGQVYIYNSDRLNSVNLHGTGCTLSSCIASKLAYNVSLPEAVYQSIQYVHSAIICGENIKVTNCTENGPLNHIYSTAKGIPHVSNVAMDYESMLALPSVKQSWENYINHEFVEMVSNGTMNMERFHKYLKQDYNYLQVFARIHAKLAADTEDLEHFERETMVLQNIIHEMAKQESILGENIKTHVKSIEMLNYTNYLKEVAQYGTWEQLYTASMPCCLGYVFAVRKIADKITVTEESHPDLYQWLQEYLRPDFYEAALDGIKTLDIILKQSHDAPTLVKIFQVVCDLECKFWDQ
ncbi:uncharacterized protein KLLA0_B13926g [Kluyveromyces lactis]|uniref:KLLA0B13926p n=1 Tax=Kluyveromyces lactis (strain ATCC 8585 / CBS 2359 / DSM 70799 / NBRC 1267 / NRRL Y-1140 / WM37) TaxID=284590 RepID=Q6CV88_KLULA|nr:uncharacterized protein KLLA0_B13926g [Kluyveromyces lactis]CAH02544.1 KLLA0B13926p [Kluyveromyces lactis]|eukprot:XP_452151.1 uncharacterized protein KLLA0_B13926g [Kluyveromyces lactis]